MFLKIYKTKLLFFSILCLLSTHECYPFQFVLEKVHKVVLSQVSDKILTLNNHKLPFGSSFFFFSIPTYIISTNVWHKDFNVTNWDKKKPRALLQNFSSGVFIPLSAGYLWQLGTSNFFFGLGIGIDISQYKYTYDYSRSQLSKRQWKEINNALPIEKIKKIKEENKELSFFWKLINKFTPPCFKKKEDKKEDKKEEKKEEEKPEEMEQKKRYYKLKDSIIEEGEKSFDEYCHKLDNMLYEYCHQSNTKSNEEGNINDKNDNINNKTEDIDTSKKNNNLNVTSYKTKEIEAGVNSFISRYKMYLPEEEKKTNEQQQNIQNNINNGQNGINNNVNNNQVPPQNQVANNSKNICIGDIYKAFKDRNIKDEFRKKAEENANKKAEENANKKAEEKAKKEAKENMNIKIEDNKELNEEEKKKIENEKKKFIEEEKKKLLDEHYENLLEVLYRDYYNFFYPETRLLWSPVNKNLSFTLINFGPKVYITYLSNKIDPTYGWSLSFFFRGGLQILWDICGNANEAITLYEDYKNYEGDYSFTNLRFISPFIAAGFEVGYSIFQFIFEVKTFNYASILKKLRMQATEDYYYANFKEESYKNVINKDNDLYYRSNQQDDDEYTKYGDDDQISFFPVKSSIWKSLIFSISVNINSIS